jgi:hypothetical protein
MALVQVLYNLHQTLYAFAFLNNIVIEYFRRAHAEYFLLLNIPPLLSTLTDLIKFLADFSKFVTADLTLLLVLHSYQMCSTF